MNPNYPHQAVLSALQAETKLIRWWLENRSAQSPGTRAPQEPREFPQSRLLQEFFRSTGWEAPRQ